MSIYKAYVWPYLWMALWSRKGTILFEIFQSWLTCSRGHDAKKRNKIGGHPGKELGQSQIVDEEARHHIVHIVGHVVDHDQLHRQRIEHRERVDFGVGALGRVEGAAAHRWVIAILKKIWIIKNITNYFYTK